MWIIRGLIGSELGSFLSITAVDAIESKIFQNRQPTRTQRASTHHAAAPEPLGSRISALRRAGQGLRFSLVRQLSALRSQVLRRGERCWSAGVETRKEVLRQVLRQGKWC